MKREAAAQQGRKKRTVIAIIILLMLGFIVGQVWFRPTAFKQGFKQLSELDQKYGTAYAEERLNRTMIGMQNADAMIEALEKKKFSWEQEENTSDVQALNLFTEIRIKMIKSQKFFQLGEQLGDIGKAVGGFRCSEEAYLLNAAYYYNQSWVQGLDAQLKIDDLLYAYRDVSGMQALVGVNDNKTKFFYSPLSAIKHIAINNVDALKKYCGYESKKPLVLQKLK